jgi:catechol 2,3-dioxygenase-like lactoylglutathione lyase family enzyme
LNKEKQTMLDHIGIRTRHIDRALAFYEAAMAALGGGMRMEVPKDFTGGVVVRGYGREMPVFWLTEVAADAPQGSPVHLAFSARNRAEVDAFYTAAMAAGGQDNGAPGLRAQYHPNYYGAFVLDPDGNNIEAVCHLPE